MKCLSMCSTYQLAGCAASWFSIVFPNTILLYIKLPISPFGLFYSSGNSHSAEREFFLSIAFFLQLSSRLLSWKLLTPVISGRLRMIEQVFKSGAVQPLWSAVLIAATARNYVITHLHTKSASVNPSHSRHKFWVFPSEFKSKSVFFWSLLLVLQVLPQDLISFLSACSEHGFITFSFFIGLFWGFFSPQLQSFIVWFSSFSSPHFPLLSNCIFCDALWEASMHKNSSTQKINKDS